MSSRKTIRVVAAVIRRGDRIFVTQRGYGNYKDWWEFPGGKIEPGESPEGGAGPGDSLRSFRRSISVDGISPRR